MYACEHTMHTQTKTHWYTYEYSQHEDGTGVHLTMNTFWQYAYLIFAFANQHTQIPAQALAIAQTVHFNKVPPNNALHIPQTLPRTCSNKVNNKTYMAWSPYKHEKTTCVACTRWNKKTIHDERSWTQPKHSFVNMMPQTIHIWKNENTLWNTGSYVGNTASLKNS